MGQVHRVPFPARLRRLALLLVASVMAAACSGSPSASPAASATPTPTAVSTSSGGTPAPLPTPAPTMAPTPGPSEPLAVVAAFVGDDTATVYLSDWDRMRGGAATTPADPAERLALIRSLEPRAPAAGYAMSRFRGHRATWGWDTLDLAWEANLVGGGAPVFVLGFAKGFDLAPVIAHFRDRGFTEVRRGSALVFAHPLDLAVDWLNTTDLAIQNTAILEDAGLMVLSSSPDELDRALDRLALSTVPAGSRAAAFAAVTAAIGVVDAEVVELRDDLCATLPPRDDVELGAVAATLHPWAALAGGWSTTPSGVTARIAIAYEEAEFAAADLAGRARLAREGSTGDGRPLAAASFRLLDARADGALILLDVEPAGGLPARILQAFLRRDLVLAACE